MLCNYVNVYACIQYVAVHVATGAGIQYPMGIAFTNKLCLGASRKNNIIMHVFLACMGLVETATSMTLF